MSNLKIKSMEKSKFLQKAKNVHNNKYDYTNVPNKLLYKDNICIICPEHGEFWQNVGNHLGGSGCPKCADIRCANKRASTTEEFIAKAKDYHGDKYDYSKVNYINNHEKVCIICPKHGEFWQKPNSHLSCGGCPSCGNEAVKKKLSLSQEEFIKRAKGVHNNFYIYDKVEYKNFSTKIIITCPIHGDFEQLPQSHLNGHGCPKCKFDKVGKIRQKTTEQFIKEATAIHKSKYSYDKTKYTSCSDPITVTCPIHGDFQVAAYTHLIAGDCPYCSGKYNLSTFIEKASKVHNNYYLYNNSIYTSSKNSITITCPKHGDFNQVAADHLRGAGCPKCCRSHGETFIASWLTEHAISYIEQYKIYNNCRFYKLDFYIEVNNKKFAIEFNGQQHYEVVEHFGGVEKFERQLERDLELKECCKNNNILLFEIKYDSNIEEELANIIKEITAVPTSDCKDNDSAKTVKSEMIIPC